MEKQREMYQNINEWFSMKDPYYKEMKTKQVMEALQKKFFQKVLEIRYASYGPETKQEKLMELAEKQKFRHHQAQIKRGELETERCKMLAFGMMKHELLKDFKRDHFIAIKRSHNRKQAVREIVVKIHLVIFLKKFYK